MPKTIQVTLTDHAYDLLRLEADRQKIKVATLAQAILRRELERKQTTGPGGFERRKTGGV